MQSSLLRKDTLFHDDAASGHREKGVSSEHNLAEETGLMTGL